jgi:hypothetical protein
MSVGAILDALPATAGPVEILGDGALAGRLRSRLPQGPGRPTAVIDTTGDPAAVRDALGRVADLGTVVLARPLPATGTADLYGDLHVRGLTVIGVPEAAP